MVVSDDREETSMVSESDDDEEEDMEDFFGNNLKRFKALREAANSVLPSSTSAVAVPNKETSPIPQSTSNRIPSVESEDNNNCDRNCASNIESCIDTDSAGNESSAAHDNILRELDPDNIALVTKKRKPLDDDKYDWMNEKIVDEFGAVSDIKNDNNSCTGKSVCDEDDDVILVDAVSTNKESAFSHRLLLLVEAGAKCLRISCAYNERMMGVFERVAEFVDSNVTRVCLSHGDRVIDPAVDTPASLGLKQLDSLEYWEMRNSPSSSSAANDDVIMLKMQSASRRDTLHLPLPRGMPLSTVMQQYSRQRQVPLDRLRFSFDGELLSSQETAESLDLEGGECIDVFET